uniref:Putative histone acetyltransferase pcaf/saga/ada n=1 Tax=Panstrongylus megistus TaxID=65343 RepID=A0A069DYZ8_9HEMI
MKAKYSTRKDKGKDSNNFTGTNGKQKEVQSHSSEGTEEADFVFPILKTIDKARHLHCYSNLLNKNKDDGAVSMEELDRLQPELELMLSAAAVRSRTLQAEIDTLNQAEDTAPDKATLILSQKKRKLNDANRVTKSMKDLSKVRDRDTSSKMDGVSSGNDSDNSGEMICDTPKDSLKVSLPKNDIPNKFWASVEPYVGEITENNIKELENLITTCDTDLAGIKIPPLGKHYTERWSEEELRQERQASSVTKQPKTGGEVDAINMLKRASNMCNDMTPGPLVQRLVSALMEEPSHDSFNKLEENDNSLYLAKLPLYHTTACFEHRIRRELEAVGLLEANDHDEADEVLIEIKKCEEELKIVAAQNKEHLTELLAQARHEMKRQEIKRKIKSLDSELIDIYRKTNCAKLKKKQLQRKERDQAWKVLKDREMLLKSLDSL